MTLNKPNYDVLIIGTGAAGLALALSLPESKRIALISKEELAAGSTPHAQGGIAAALHSAEDIESHIADTLKTGCGLCDPETVRFTVTQAHEAMEWLLAQGVPFTTQAMAQPQLFDLHLTQEGGHSQRRIAHVADHTGSAVVKTLLDHVLERNNIDCFINHYACELIRDQHRCYGAHFINLSQHTALTLTAHHTILATGGSSAAYAHTTNPISCVGDGITMAYRAGIPVANMELMQFHPTSFYTTNTQSFLVSEALRGEGAYLINRAGKRFMLAHHPLAELAPRDHVVRAITQQLSNDTPCVYIDISHQPAQDIVRLFPTIAQKCQQEGIDITREPIPVVPAAHYTCGGIVTNRHGQTDLPGLYALGETAHTGLHGANRIASNSLLECIVFAAAASKHITQTDPAVPDLLPTITTPSVTQSPLNSNQQQQIKAVLWQDVGIIRSTASLKRAHTILSNILANLPRLPHQLLDHHHYQTQNLCQMALLITEGARKRQESRGVHWHLDYPQSTTQPHNIIQQQSTDTLKKI